MATYEKTEFHDGASPAITANELNKIGDGILEALNNPDKANSGRSTPSQTDLNDITVAGWYWITTTQTTNKPANQNYGLLEVIRSSGNESGVVVQRFTSTGSVIYERIYVNNAWTDWTRAATLTNGTLSIANGGTGLSSSPSALVNLASTTAETILKASPRIGVTGTLPIANGGTGRETLTANAVLFGNGTDDIGMKPSANGALYATQANGALSWGTLPVAQGGTGKTSLTGSNSLRSAMGLGTGAGALAVANGGTGATSFTSGALLVGSGQDAIGTRSIAHNDSTIQAITRGTEIPTKSTIAWWDGSYNTSGNSNLKYLGTVTKGTWQGSTIGVSYGGTGLTSSPSMLTNLGSTSADNVLKASPRPGITGTLGIGNGGTGATTWSGIRSNLYIGYGTSLPNTNVVGHIYFKY